MPIRPSRSLIGTIHGAFAERRIYVRTGGKTRYLAIRPASQIFGALAIAALLGWTGFTTTAYVTDAMDGHSARVRLETMSEAYQARLAAYAEHQRSLEAQLHQANQRRDRVTERLSDKQARLVETANNLQDAATELAALREKFVTLVDARRDDATPLEFPFDKFDLIDVIVRRIKTVVVHGLDGDEQLVDLLDISPGGCEVAAFIKLG